MIQQPQHTTIPSQSTIQRMNNGDALICFPNALVPTLCVQQNGCVRAAISSTSITSALADAARRYIQEHA